MSGKPTVEILVHTTAPSRAADDINYRNLAAAYLDFEPTVRSELGSLHLGNEVRDRSGTGRERNEPRDEYSGLGGIPAFQQSFGFNSSNISFGSADHNLISPELRRTQGHVQTQVSDSQSSWRAPPSVIADSNPENNISIAQYCSPTRILEHYLQGVESSQSSTSQHVSSRAEPISSPTATRQPTIPQSQTPILPLGRQLPSPSTSELSVIPQSPLFTGRKRTRQELPTSALKQTVIASSIVSPDPGSSPPRAYQPEIEVEIPSTVNDSRYTRSLSLSAADCIPSSRPEPEAGPLLKRQRQLQTEANGSSLVRSSSDIGPRQDQTRQAFVSQRPTSTPFSTALEIRSPEPPVSCADLAVTDVVTPRLEKLAKDVKLEKRFEHRKKQARDLRPFERGYWLVDCSSWPEEAKQMAWGFLGNYVGNGLAGWGIWCRRDEDFQTLRLYCWGCVAGYMFLVLWLSSQRELNYVKSTWIAGDGQAVITMDAKYKRP